MSYLFTILICAVNFESYTVFFVSNMIFFLYDLLFMGWQAAPIIILLTRKPQSLTRKGKQLTRKVGVKFYGFIFLIETDIFGQFQHKNCAADNEKTLSLGSTFTRCISKTAQSKGLFETEIQSKNLKVSINLEVLIW